MSEEEKKAYVEALFKINVFYGKGMYLQVKDGLDRFERLINIINIDETDYNKVIEKLILLKVGNVLSYVCWCSHGEPGISPYAIYIQGNNLSADVKCPICGEDLHKMKIVILSPIYYIR